MLAFWCSTKVVLEVIGGGVNEYLISALIEYEHPRYIIAQIRLNVWRVGIKSDVVIFNLILGFSIFISQENFYQSFVWDFQYFINKKREGLFHPLILC